VLETERHKRKKHALDTDKVDLEPAAWVPSLLCPWRLCLVRVSLVLAGGIPLFYDPK